MATTLQGSAGMSSSVGALVTLLEHQQLDAYASLAATVFYLWDTIITMNDEITYIWGSRTSTVKIFYFLNRYFRLLMSIALTVFTAWPKPFTTMCLTFGISGTVGVGVIGTFMTGVILQIRLYALYNRSTKLVICVGLLFAMQMSSISVLAGLEVATMLQGKSTIIIPGIPFCFNHVSSTFFAICIPIVSFDLIVLVLVCYKSVQRYRLFPPTSQAAQNGKHLVAVLFRDSILYFAVNVAVYLANVLMWQYGPPELYSLITTWCNVVTGAAASRILVNTRRAVRVREYVCDDIPTRSSKWRGEW
ncbi:hypothetical protein P691DRAFT_801461 [Macrolepiota fuliginosa MF-IS2]|uniref:DUF6533 domain-containing protein n=1 Tax=Macrolepiota fuliginosa MF-IS2 TaxID=1400762 RepID=A0A9P5WZQ8_9AGAR|nr:hypothetical protein P691DRAFT_801461 [Macrolepiota fuliginosa MF-IS2]